jgi:hypothetical protein
MAAARSAARGSLRMRRRRGGGGAMVEARPRCVPAEGEVAARSTEEGGGATSRRVVGACGVVRTHGRGRRTHAGPDESSRDVMKVLMVFFLHFILFSSRDVMKVFGYFGFLFNLD